VSDADIVPQIFLDVRGARLWRDTRSSNCAVNIPEVGPSAATLRKYCAHAAWAISQRCRVPNTDASRGLASWICNSDWASCRAERSSAACPSMSSAVNAIEFSDQAALRSGTAMRFRPPLVQARRRNASSQNNGGRDFQAP
jgi:hypothetical protein